MLKSIELNGFKSFAKRSDFVFNSPISAIVGPNGSGKSNIAEAFRFVLGEQSMKSMRGKRGEDLIFNGSPDTPKANRASVKLVFNNNPKVFSSVDFNEVVLERVVYRDGTNEYLINGSKVRLKDIVELLSEAHIGMTGHHIISQGEADRILSANSKERRDMIEDALGLKAYQYKKEESERKLERTRENMKQVESLRKEIAPHLRFLKKQMEKVARTEELRKELTLKAGEFFGAESFFIKTEKEKILAELAPDKKELARVAEGIRTAKEKLEAGSKVHDLSKNLQEAERNREKLRQEVNETVRELGRLEGELSALKRMSEKVHSAVPFETARDFLERLSFLVDELKNFSEKGDIEQVKVQAEAIEREIKNFRTANTAENGQTDFSEILVQKEKLAGKLIELKKDEEQAVKHYTLIAKQVEEEKEGSRTAEKAVYELLSKEKEFQTRIAILTAKERELIVREDDLKQNMAEIGAMIGRAFLDEILRNQKSFEISPDHDTKRKEVERLKIRLEESGIGGTADIEKEFNEVSERDVFLEKELADLDTSAGSLEQLIVDLSEKLEVDFAEGLEKINSAFEEFFSILFGGGKASLTIKSVKKRIKKTDNESGLLEEVQEEQEESGIDIAVSLPRKKISGLMMLSGGERALTSIALIFAMSQVNPPPFIILDETDAALDEANSKRYGDMVENLAAKSQLIVITHNRETMSRAGVIYGVTMAQGGVSKVLSIAFAEAEEIAK